MDIEKIRKDFPMLQKPEKPIYFDNACTTLKPQSVIDAIAGYYSGYSGCAGRSAHHIAKRTDQEFELARQKIAKFVGTDEHHLVFTRNTTESLNLVASSLQLPKGKTEIVTTIMEHHSAYLPFKSKYGNSVKVVKNISSIAEWEAAITDATGLIVVHGVNNTIGTSPPLDRIVKLARDKGALIMVDGAQAVPHSEISMKKSGFDFLAFSGHKMLGPTGIGGLAMSERAFGMLEPFIIGGGTVETVTLENIKYLTTQKRFEAGIQHYAGAIGLAAAVDYLSKVGMANIAKHEHRLIDEMQKRSAEITSLKLYGDFKDKKSAIMAFNLGNLPAHQVTMMLDSMSKICTRSGVFCAEPAMTFIGAGNGAVRASLYLYNTLGELDIFFNRLEEISKTLS